MRNNEMFDMRTVLIGKGKMNRNSLLGLKNLQKSVETLHILSLSMFQLLHPLKKKTKINPKNYKKHQILSVSQYTSSSSSDVKCILNIPT